MKVFLSWSGESSRALADVLHKWLASVFSVDDATFWISHGEPGIRWSHEMDRQLKFYALWNFVLGTIESTAP